MKTVGLLLLLIAAHIAPAVCSPFKSFDARSFLTVQSSDPKYETLSTKLVEVNATLHDLLGKFNSLQNDRLRTETAVSEMETSITEVKASQDALEDDVSSLESSITTLQGDIKQVKDLQTAANTDQLKQDVDGKTEDLREETKSVFRGCGSPPEVPNTDVINGGDFVNAVASYTCKSDFKPCDLPTESRCQANGEWTAMTGLCSQFRWHNPAVPFDEALPCQGQDQEVLHIKIKATPTAERRMFFALMADKDLVLIVDCRFNYLGTVRRTVLNTKINGRFGQEVRPTVFPFKVNETFGMEITLSNGNYQISVGEQTWTFKERTVGVSPKRAIVQHDINVELIEILM